MPGAIVPARLYRYAVPVPAAISVNIFKLRFTSESQPGWKIGQPAHRTTGVASANSSQGRCKSKYINISRLPVGKTLNQNLCGISTYSGFTSSREDKVSVAGSSAMPHFGHDPGPILRTSGCIGQVYSAESGCPDIGAGIGSGCPEGCRYFSGLASDFA